MSAEEQAAEAEAMAEIQKRLSSQAFRLSNLYWVEDELGRKVKFKPRWEQRELHNNLHDLNAVLKCRQPGISTYCAILMLDFVLFSPNKTGAVVDKTDEDAKRKLEKITFAYDHLDDPDDPTTAAIGALIKRTIWKRTDNKKEFALSNGSKIWAGTGMRGGTIQFLWITELGYTSYYDPEKAKEIKKGALNTVHAGSRVIVESTHEGGKYGEWYSILKLAMEAKMPLSALDWAFHFFAWHKHAAYTMSPPDGWAPDKDHADYFAELFRDGIHLTEGQKYWYVKKEASIGVFMKSEFPSTPQEAFEAVIKGAIYGKLISALRAKKRIVDFEHDPALPLYCFWDIGYSDFTAIWLIQFCGRDICALAYRCNTQQLPSYYAAITKEWERDYGIPIANHFLPHDADHKEFGGKSAKDHLREAGLKNMIVVPVIRDTWTGINHLRAMLPRFVFHKTNCGHTWTHDGQDMPSGVQCLEGYHTKEDGSSGVIMEKPVHDGHSHGCLQKDSLIELTIGSVPIDQVRAGDRVKLADGSGLVKWAGYVKHAETVRLELSNGAFIECTPEHKIFTTEGVIEADKCRIGASVVMHSHPCINHLLTSPIGVREGFSDYIAAGGITCGRNETSTSARLATRKTCFICACGRTITDLFRTAKSSILQGVRETSNVLSFGTRVAAERVGCANIPACGFTGFSSSRRLGKNTFARHLPERNTEAKRFTASCGNTTKDQSREGGTFTTKTKTRRTTASAIFKSCLRRITAYFTRKQTHGPEAHRTSPNSLKSHEHLAAVVKVSRQNNFTPVYDLTIEKHGCYVANGVMVSNSDALRTCAEADLRGMIPGSTRAPNFDVKPQVIMAGWNGPRPGSQLGDWVKPRVIMN